MIQQNEYVMKKMFGSFFLATVMSALMAHLGGLTNSVIIGHLVSPDALSVVRMWTPIESVMFIIIGVMSAGASFISTRSIGGQDYDKVNRVFNHHLYYVIVATLLVIALVLPFTDALGSLVTTDERLVPLLTPFIHADYFAIFFAAVCGVPMSYIISNGNPELITRRIVISQLLNALFGQEMTRTGKISDAHDKGMHTTTFSEMYFLENGAIIDTPGIKGFGTIDFQKEEVSHYFREIFEAGRDCRFGNCTHTNEPGCAVQDKIITGDIAISRYESYLSMLCDCTESKYR